MAIILNNLLALAKRLLLLIILYSFTRLVFYINNFNTFPEIHEIFKSFIYGIRFDYAAIFYVNIIIIILHLNPFIFSIKKIYRLSLKIFFVIVNGASLLSNIIDAEYFKYTLQRSSADLFFMFFSNKGQSLKQSFLYMTDYPALLAVFVLCVLSLIFFYPKYKIQIKDLPVSKTKKILIPFIISVLLLSVSIIISRGMKYKALRIISAVEYVSPTYSPLILNTPFTILNSYSHKSLEEKKYFNDTTILNFFSPVKRKNDTGIFKNKNIVIIILESFSSEFTSLSESGRSYTPFFDRIMRQGLTCTRAYSNAKRSIEGIPAIISSFPALMPDAYISSQYSANKVMSIAQIMKSCGYNTSFFHGGINGTMGLDNYCLSAGFDKYYGEDEYPNSSDFDGSWGIYDEPFFQFFANKLNSFSQPFLSSVFSLSSHHPYSIPEKHKQRFGKYDNKILGTIAYTDYALHEFFDTAKKMKWYYNTIFIICADHPFQSYEQANSFHEQYSIPIVFFCPSDTTLKGTYGKITQQIDIMPSLLDYLGYNNAYIAFGNSIFRDKDYRYIIEYNNGIYALYDSNNDSVFFNGEKFIYNKPESMKYNMLPQNIIKAFIQTYNNRIIYNMLSDTIETFSPQRPNN